MGSSINKITNSSTNRNSVNTSSAGVTNDDANQKKEISVVPQSLKNSYFKFLSDYKVGDQLGIVGIILSIIGLWISVKTLRKADDAKVAAEKALIHKSRVDAASALLDVVRHLAEIKNLHASKNCDDLINC